MPTREKPILMSALMVRAILDGRKTQTRRVVKPQPISNPAGPNYDRLWSDTKDPVTRYFGCPYGQPGDRLWVRETFYCDDYRYPNIPEDERNDPEWRNQMLYYRADGADLCQQIPECDCSEAKGCWRPPMFMFRWASRINLELTEVRVERVQDISEEDAMAEGVDWQATAGLSRFTAKKLYATLWDSINAKKHPWASNPWVWVLTFKRI